MPVGLEGGGRWMPAPTELPLRDVKRMGRYLEGRPRQVYEYFWQTVDITYVYSDTGWAGCMGTRRSNSRGA